jgi:hypothetical protein
VSSEVTTKRKPDWDKLRMDPLVRDRIDELFTSVRAGAELRKRTDVEFAKVLETLLSDKDVLSVEYEVLEQAVSRLERSQGGALPDEPDDDEGKTTT